MPGGRRIGAVMEEQLHITRVPLQHCPNCGVPLDATGRASASKDRPQPGNATVCLNCGHLMVFADDMSLRAPTDAEVVELAADADMLRAQTLAGRISGREALPDFRAFPIPERMRHLDRDPRGYPIFAMAYRDATGKPHFTVNDQDKRHRLVVEDRCSICGGKLFRGRWFLGGPGSALHPRGAYVDPPMHDECVHYALHVCPHLTNPNYDKGVRGRTIARDDPVLLFENENVGEFRPNVFMAVLARGQRVHSGTLGTDYIIPKRPFIRVEYWQNGVRLPAADGERLAAECMQAIEHEVKQRVAHE